MNRAMLAITVIASLAMLVLSACGSDEPSPTAVPAAAAVPTATPQPAPTPTPTATPITTPSPTAITVDDVTGIWRLTEEGYYVQYNADGTYRYASSIGGLEKTPVDVGTFTLDGTILTEIATEGGVWKVGDRYILEMELVDENRMRAVLQEQECEVGFGRKIYNLERVP